VDLFLLPKKRRWPSLARIGTIFSSILTKREQQLIADRPC
jgi:hypothetical protein